MMVETGYPYAWAVGGTTYNYSGTYAYSMQVRRVHRCLITMLNKHSKVTGLFWWWPEYNAKGTSLSGWYNAPLFDSRTGRATSAFTALAKYATTSTGISPLNASTSKTTDDHYYDLSGRSVSQPKDSGVYIHHKKKIIVR
jgi:arabinogalactan endo-1,4-beta-galactosidase